VEQVLAELAEYLRLHADMAYNFAGHVTGAVAWFGEGREGKLTVAVVDEAADCGTPV
jgi:hypothetical protein